MVLAGETHGYGRVTSDGSSWSYIARFLIGDTSHGPGRVKSHCSGRRCVTWFWKKTYFMVLVEFTSCGSDRVTCVHNLVGATCTVHNTVSLGVSSQGSGGIHRNVK